MKLSKWKLIHGDEPIKYVNSQTSKQEYVQKQWYQCGLNKDDPDKTPKTFNKTIDISKIIFEYKLSLPTTTFEQGSYINNYDTPIKRNWK